MKFNLYSFVTKAALFTVALSMFYFSILFGLYPTSDFSKEKLNVCFLDDFEKTSKDKKPHGEKVISVFEKYNKESVNIVKLHYKRTGFQSTYKTPLAHFAKKTLNSCDIINYSMGSKSRKEGFIKSLTNFIENYDGKIIASAGNEDLTHKKSEWSYLRKKNKDAHWNDKIIIVSQGKIYKDSDLPISKDMLIIDTSHGSEINYVVDYEISKLDEVENYNGSSYSTPVITALTVSEIFGNSFYEENGFKISLKENKNMDKIFEDKFHVYKTISKNE